MIRLALDRFEDALVVLVAEDGTAIDFPRALLPADAKAGDVLTLAIAVDEAATRDVVERTRRVQEELGRTDPGGDLEL